MFSRNVFLKIVAIFVFGFFAISFAQVTAIDTSGNGDFTVPTRGGDNGAGSESSGGGGNPGAYIMILQAQQKAEAEKAQQEALLQAQKPKPKPKPAEVKPEPVEPVIEPVPTMPIDLSASAVDSGFDGKGVGIAIVVLSILGIGAYTIRNTPENKAKRKGKRCLHVKDVLEANLKEITSIEERIQDMVEDKVDSTKVRLAKKLLKMKKRREKYSKLFEDCVIKTDDRKTLVVVHSNNPVETTAWVVLLKNAIKKDKYEIKMLDATNESALLNTKPAKDTLFILTGSSVDIMNSKFSSNEDYISISSANMGDIVERLKSF